MVIPICFFLVNNPSVTDGLFRTEIFHLTTKYFSYLLEGYVGYTATFTVVVSVTGKSFITQWNRIHDKYRIVA